LGAWIYRRPLYWQQGRVNTPPYSTPALLITKGAGMKTQTAHVMHHRSMSRLQKIIALSEEEREADCGIGEDRSADGTLRGGSCNGANPDTGRSAYEERGLLFV